MGRLYYSIVLVTNFSHSNSVSFVGKEKGSSTYYNALNKIIYEVAEIFSNQSTLYFIKNEVSLGGDEVSEDAWIKTSTCQNDWEQLTSLEKSHKFFKEVSNKLTDIKISGWQQFIQNDDQSLGKERVQADKTGRVWIWNTAENGIMQAANLANNSYPVVLTFADETYFDLAYNPDINELGFSWATQFSDTESALRSSLSSKLTQEKTFFFRKYSWHRRNSLVRKSSNLRSFNLYGTT